MGIYIKGMEMPKNCGQCKLFHAEHPMYCTATEGHRTVGAPYGMPRPDWCPLTEVKTPHGRWERKPDPYGFFDTIPVCSACGCTTKYRETSICCPNCGAKMDEEEG